MMDHKLLCEPFLGNVVLIALNTLFRVAYQYFLSGTLKWMAELEMLCYYLCIFSQ
jgi:hypothetical protein